MPVNMTVQEPGTFERNGIQISIFLFIYIGLLTRVVRGESESNIVGRGAANAHSVASDRILEVIGRTSSHSNHIEVMLK